MFHFSRIFITIPLLALLLASLAVKPAAAATLSAVEGLRVLARAKAADSHCHFLPAGEHDELASYQSRAEIASASLMPPKAVHGAVAAGEDDGRTVACNAAARSDVSETLRAAREAIAAVDGGRVRASTPVAEPDPVKDLSVWHTAKPVPLSVYGALVKPYFVDLRCHDLSGRDARGYFRAVVGLQKVMVAAKGTAAVAAAQGGARNSAGAVPCGQASAAASVKGLKAILGN